jgi:glycosyltransferase involved in cell wall biosynthesis
MLNKDCIFCIIREPFIDKIPSLKTLIWSLSEKKEIYLISSTEDKYPAPSFSNRNIYIISVKKRLNRFELPTTVKLCWTFLKVYFQKKPEICIGGDVYSNLILSSFSRILHFKHIFFMLEYPQIKTSSYKKLSARDIREIMAMQRAHTIITHDAFHKNFLIDNFHINSDKIFTLPNATFTEIKSYKSDFLQKSLGISLNKKIILHSGGLGVWFKSKELANSTINWPENTILIFHTSHKVDGDEYFRELSQKDYNGKVVFSTSPVPTDELDHLVCSATIGIATYSKEILGYRAEMMGLAAGKIGNYLKCGLPVIATRTVSFSYITDYKCGILIDKESEIAQAIAVINKNYKEFSDNAKRCFKEIWEPEKYLNKIELYLERAING